MIDTDISPPDSPTGPQQYDALKKGLGRALLWGAAGKLEVDLLLKACLNDLRYDWQIEPVRSDWLWEIIQACDAAERLRTPVLDAFLRLPEESADQLCGLARHFAITDGEFRTRLYEVVRVKPVTSMDWLGESELLALDGAAGFEFAAGIRGERLEFEPWDWAHTSLMDDAIGRWGRDRAVQVLETSAVPGAQRFLEAWPGDSHKSVRDAENTYRDRMRAIPVADLLTAAGDTESCVWFRGWGKNANDADLRIVLEAIREENDPHRLKRLLRVFGGRPLPEFDERFLELAQHDDSHVRDMAIRALEPTSHPAIRELGLTLMADSRRVEDSIALFINNYAAGDETKICSAISRMADGDPHSALIDAENVLHENASADPLALGLLIYRNTPCAHCRESVAELLHRRNVMPTWMRDELRFDSYEDARKLAETSSEEKTTRD